MLASARELMKIFYFGLTSVSEARHALDRQGLISRDS
jgi:hypothetical protein